MFLEHHESSSILDCPPSPPEVHESKILPVAAAAAAAARANLIKRMTALESRCLPVVIGGVLILRTRPYKQEVVINKYMLIEFLRHEA